ncbi:MAG: nitroreductase [Cryomorphaceae bacterium]|nr:nitroreductase [Cryomorphaceae bacterium]
MDVLKMITERRSTYPPLFTGAEIPAATIEKMLESARFAPTHKITEPWRFTVFSGDGKSTFARAWAEAYRNHSQSNGTFSQIQYDKMLTKPLQCSHIIAVGMKRNPIIPEFEEICSVACAVQNMMLVAAHSGAGGYWSTGGHQFFDAFANYFSLADEDRLLGFLFLGVPKDIPLPPRERRSVDDFTRWVST